jgi:leucyl-tRNA synthetase
MSKENKNGKENKGESSHKRRDELVVIQESVQKQWLDQKVHEIDAKAGSEGTSAEKFFCTFPYPYMNGVLHLGHAFTLAKSEFAARYNKLLGKTVLYPFAFHCTGMPICASAQKLEREIKLYGNPPIFPEPEPEPEEVKEVKAEKKSGKNKKGKLLKKKSKHKFQWQIMEEIGVPSSEIAAFQDPVHWLSYFPPIAMDHLKAFGLYTDFRRSFITTDANPYYDQFIRWHFEVLREKKKIQFGNRNAIFSPIDNQACADHDRSAGEGAGISEFTLIKLRLLEFPEEVKAILAAIGENEEVKAITEEHKEVADALANPSVFCPAATLRPETMYGQTNLFMLPTGNYGMYLMKNGDIFVCSSRSALNMSYQNLTTTRGKPVLLGEVLGQAFMGKPVSAPLAQAYERVYILPLLTIKMQKGTGVVTSVPSDAPDDYAALMDLKNKPALRAKYGIADEHVLPFDVVAIIHTPNVGNPPTAEGEGNCPARDLCIELKVQSQNDSKKLETAKDACYKNSFAHGVMAAGEYKGMAVSKAKPKIKADMVRAGLGCIYAEPDTYVESRTGNECVVALSDQWYLEYGEDDWKAVVATHNTDVLNTYSDATKKKFTETIEWLKEWACSRTFGLGTRLPWDEKWVVESLSDSTIYMAYYTIAHFLQGGVLNGSEVGPAGIRPEQLTVDVFNYIFRHKTHPTPPETDIPVATLDQLRTEFEFWYPMDLRVSGKDLIGNHLTMSLYNHAAVWEEQPEMMPRSFFTNGHLMINAAKMSKSTGNFMTMMDAINRYGADATRYALADAGDSLEDANFEEQVANNAILRLTKELVFVTETLADETLRTDSKLNFFDTAFDNQISACIVETKEHMDSMSYHKALVSGGAEMFNIRDNYRASVDGPLHRDLLVRWIEAMTVMISPFCPHFAQHVWTALGKNGFVVNEGRWPETRPVDALVLTQAQYLQSTAHNIRTTHAKKVALAAKQAKKKKTTPERFNVATILVTREYNPIQQACLRLMTSKIDEGVTESLPKACAADIKSLPELKGDKKAVKGCLQFIGFVASNYANIGRDALALTLSYDEVEFLTDHLSYLKQGSDLLAVRVAVAPADSTAEPGRPALAFSWETPPDASQE